jgi:Domain of unknown function DUF11/Secretion system C-terminal sorting domain
MRASRAPPQMDYRFKGVFAVAALCLGLASPASAATVFVGPSGTDVIGCGAAGGAFACLTIQYAIDLASTVDGDIISVAGGVYTESVTVDKELSLAGTAGVSVVPPLTSTHGFAVAAENVTIDSFEIDGSTAFATMWAGVSMFGGYSGVSITNNEIHDVDALNPSSSWGAGATIKYAYGIWTMGGGSVGSRDPISGLNITGNDIYDIGDGAATGGVGMYLKSIFGGSAGTGATIQGNTMDLLAIGPTEVSGVSHSFIGIGIAVLQDDDLAETDSGVQVGGDSGGEPNTYGDLVVGVVIQTTSSRVDEDNLEFDAPVAVLAINQPHPSISAGALLATIDEGQLAPYVKSTEVDLTASPGLGVAGTVGYFRDLGFALLNSSPAAELEIEALAPAGGTPLTGTITSDGTTITLTLGGTVFTVNKAALEAAGIPLIVQGTDGDDAITMDPNALPTSGFLFNSGTGNDELTIGTVVAPFISYTHTPGTIGACGSGEDGTFQFLPGSVDLDYCGLAPVIDLSALANKTFLATVAAETITVVQDPGAPTRTLIDAATFESVSFVNPTVSLTIEALAGDDTIQITGFGSGVTTPTVTVNGGAGNDIVDFDGVGGMTPTTLNLNGEADEDSFLVDPVAVATDINVDGGAPAICQGDLLDFELAATQTLTFTPDPPADGTATFGVIVETAVDYVNIERFVDQEADLQLVSVILDDTNMFVGDDGTITITVTNLGTDPSQCLQVDLSGLPGILNIDEDDSVTDFDPVVSAGIFNRITKIWAIDALAALGSETLVIPFVVDTQLTGLFQIPATVSSSNTDLDLTNNAEDDTLNVLSAFAFPSKANAIAAAFDTLASGLERMVIGTFLGSPGINGAVWCRVPDSDGDILNLTGVPALYRVCSDGLPNVSGSFLPLHVNDIWLDDDGSGQGRYWMTTWGNDGLYYSDDDAETWTAAEPDLGDGYTGDSQWVNVYAITEDYIDGILYVSVNNGLIFRSLNGGTNWQPVSSLPEGAADTAWSLRSHPTAAGLLFAGTFGKGVYVSTNYGITWDELEFNSTLLAAQAAHIFDLEIRADPANLGSDFIFAATSRGIWRKSLDMGADWEEIPAPGITPSGISPEVRSIEFGEDKSGSDGDPDLYGVTWGFGIISHPTPFDAPYVTDLEDFALRGSEMTFFAISPSGMMYAGTNDGAFYEMDPANPVGGTATATDPVAELPASVDLHQNYPNPFNPTTTIEFALPETSEVLVAVYDVLGRPVRVLQQGILSAGLHQVSFDAKDLPSGTYFYRLETPGTKITRQFVLLK